MISTSSEISTITLERRGGATCGTAAGSWPAAAAPSAGARCKRSRLTSMAMSRTTKINAISPFRAIVVTSVVRAARLTAPSTPLSQAATEVNHA